MWMHSAKLFLIILLFFKEVFRFHSNRNYSNYKDSNYHYEVFLEAKSKLMIWLKTFAQLHV